jgi:Holliday junction resolvase
MANVRRGHDTERRCANELREKGYHVIRSAASKGAFDLIAISAENILLIQCKRTKAFARRTQPKDIRSLAAADCPIAGNVKKQLWCWVDRKGWFITDVEQIDRSVIIAG